MQWEAFDKANVCDHLLSANDPHPVLLLEAAQKIQLKWTPDRFASTFRGQKCIKTSYVDKKQSSTTFDSFMLSFNQDGPRRDSFKIQVLEAYLNPHPEL